MNKTDLVRAVWEKTQLPEKDVATVLDSILATVNDV
ncbi:MAG: HU family DNA-binding protein [Firmicutes bacterium]|nr:HU family DNA-binding protein [Bacillota bacterium]MCL5064907.1 HU family DNA-binding protein [Bacillota bacterium]